MSRPGEHPLPHPELSTQTPLIFDLMIGDRLYRHHQKIHDPIFFGNLGVYRFDDPNCGSPGAFGVLYAGEDPECCLLESCGSTTGVPAVSGAYLADREIAQMELIEPLRFVARHSHGQSAPVPQIAKMNSTGTLTYFDIDLSRHQ